MSEIDRTPKPCLHPVADHQHGTRACYTLDKCRCAPCSQACTEYERDRTRQHAYGRWNNLVDAEPARQHVLVLMEAGMGRRQIALHAGITSNVIVKLIWGKRQPDGSLRLSTRLRKENADRLLAIRYNPADGALVPAIGAVRRLQALVALGWSQRKLSAELGFTSQTQLTAWVLGRRNHLTAGTFRAVRGLYERLSMQLPPQDTHRDKIAASRARKYAKARGWLPPLAWDDEHLDDPQAKPLTCSGDAGVDEAAVLRRMNGARSIRLNRQESDEVVRRLLAAGLSGAEVERRTGINVHRVQRRAS
jgi:transcriptional regulator with XRE-family HTH domain